MITNIGPLLLLLLATLGKSGGFAISSRANPRIRESSAAPLVLLNVVARLDHDERKSQKPFSLEPGHDRFTRREFGTSVTKAMAMVVTAAAALLPESTWAAEGAPVTVIGANGRTGYECVKALQARGLSCRACTRQGVYRDGNDLERVESMKCDVTDFSTIENAGKGASAVIFAASASKGGGTPAVVDNAGLVAVAKACIDAKVKHLVIVSSGAVTKPSSPVYMFLNTFGSIMSEKIQGEDAVRALYALGTPAAGQGFPIQ
jgi:NAD(P)H-binding